MWVFRATGFAGVAVLALAIPAFSQAVGTFAPAGAVFGRADDRRVRQGLDVTLSVVEGYDSDTPPVVGSGGPTDVVISGPSTMLIGNMQYRWRGSRLQIGATSESVVRNYSRFADASGVSYSAGAGLSARLGGRTTLFANQTAAYSPSYLYLLFPGGDVRDPGDTTSSAPDYTITHTDSYLYGTTLAVSRDLTARSRFSATGELQSTQFPRDKSRNQSYQGIRGEYSRGLSKHISVRGGYRYRTGRFWQITSRTFEESRLSATEHAVDLGADWSRQLSATRRVTLGLTIGSSVVKTPATPVESVPGEQFGQLVAKALVAEASGNYAFSTNWAARGSYKRGLEYATPFAQPVFADGFSAELDGLVHPRVEVIAATRYSSGASALYRSALAYDTYGTEIRIRYALARSWAIYGQYFYYFYDLRRDSLKDWPPGLERNGVRIGLTLWTPAFRR